jgi:hypothetical protein
MSIKIKRACAIAGKLPQAQAEIISSLSVDLVAQLSSKELAAVMQSLDAHWRKARAFEARAILEEGCIWDAQKGQLFAIESINFNPHPCGRTT